MEKLHREGYGKHPIEDDPLFHGLDENAALRAILAATSAATGEQFFDALFPDKEDIVQTLEKTGGVLAGPKGAAHLLGVPRTTLWSRMRKLGIAVPKPKG